MLRLDLLAPKLPWRWLAALGGVGVVACAVLWLAYLGLTPRPDAREQLEAASAQAELEAFTRGLGSRRESKVEVARGETLALVLSRADARWEQIGPALAAVSTVFDPRRIRPGQVVNVYTKDDGDGLSELMGLAFRAEPGAAVTVGRDLSGNYWAREILTPWSMQTAHVVTKINGSLYQSALAVGATEQEVAAVSNVLSFDVDFQRDLFPGDTFELVFDRYFDEDGRTIRTGDLYFIALQTRRGPKAYYYFKGPDDSDGAWYDKSGHSARKFLMKTPIDGARLTSTFGMRLHPILGYSLMHRGVDFAAGAGTPVRAAGDGVIERAGPFSSYGNYVRIRHGNGYETAYAHLSRFASGLRTAMSVRQGQVIGYVGSTGRATGPHLHYEVLLKNAQVNPMTLKLATGRNLDGSDMALFVNERDRIDALRALPAGAAPVMASAASGLRGGLE